MKSSDVPVWEKLTLTLSEAAEWSGIGINKIRELTKDDSCPFVLYVGRRRLIKREPFAAYVNRSYSI